MEDFAGFVAKQGLRALLYEVEVAPKPGLVDRFNNGAHNDMDCFTFIDSAVELEGYLREITLQGGQYRGRIEQLLYHVRETGIRAEKDMLTVTGGVNTHKGMVFSMGLIAAVLGYIHGGGLELTPANLFPIVGVAAGGVVEEIGGQNGITYGEKSHARHGLSGIRGEAAKGYPTVAEIGYPALLEYLKQGYNMNDAGVGVLLRLIAVVDDTNIIGRSSLETLRMVQNEVKEFLEKNSSREELLEFAKKLDEKLIALNISPGGSADLLALTFFLYFIFEK